MVKSQLLMIKRSIFHDSTRFYFSGFSTGMIGSWFILNSLFLHTVMNMYFLFLPKKKNTKFCDSLLFLVSWNLWVISTFSPFSHVILVFDG